MTVGGLSATWCESVCVCLVSVMHWRPIYDPDQDKVVPFLLAYSKDSGICALPGLLFKGVQVQSKTKHLVTFYLKHLKGRDPKD